jgi:hypothetical protein
MPGHDIALTVHHTSLSVADLDAQRPGTSRRSACAT